MEIQPIRTDADYEAALREVEAVFDAEPGTPEFEKLDILATLIERYEQKRWPIPAARPLEVLQFAMEQNDRTQTDLAALLGSRSRASEILSGKREITLAQIRILAREWHIPAGALVGELETA
ncbi:MAG TPA: helix-turn-helix domain-containing protein [Phenylobacterium sp.]|jgi:HTH-type transcriptional regulator/antitoxin HigA